MKNNIMLMKIINSNIFKTTIQTSLIFFFRLVAQAFTIFIIAKLLGANEFSIYAAITAIALLLGIAANFGFNNLVIFELGNSKISKKELLSYAIPTILILGFFLQIIFYLLASSIGKNNITLIPLIVVGLTEILIIPLINLNSAIIYSESKIILSQVVGTLPVFFRLVVSITIYFSAEKITANELLHTHIFIGLPCLILLTIFTLKENLHTCRYKLISSNQLVNCLKYSMINFFSVALGEADKPLTSLTLSATESGVYAVSTRIIGAVTLPVNALIVSTLNHLFKNKKIMESTSYLILITTLIYSIFSTGLVGLLSNFITPFFGESYYGLNTSLTAISIAIPAICLRISAGSILLARNMINQRMLVEFVGLIMVIILMLLINNKYHISGAIYSLAISEWFMAIVCWSLLAKKTTTSIV